MPVGLSTTLGGVSTVALARQVLPDTILINGVDLQTLCIVTDLSGLHAPGTRRGSDLIYPNVPGQTPVPKVYDAYAFDIPINLASDYQGDTDPENVRAYFLLALTNLQTALDTGGTFTMTRVLASFGPPYTVHTALGRYSSGLALQLVNPFSGTTTLEFINLDGCWTDSGGGKHL